MALASLPPRAANVAISTWAGGLAVEPVDLVASDGAPSSGLLYQSPGGRPKIGVHLMHPRTDQTRNYNIAGLAQAGCMVLARNSRSVNNDVDTLHEDLLLDVAAGVELLRRRGCETVVLVGNSGGGPLAAYYQWQAETPMAERIPRNQTVATFDLREVSLPAADALVIVGGHLGQGQTLQNTLDASVVDETDPLSIDPSLDIYDPRNGFALPVAATRYSPEFVRQVRAAQQRRVARLDQLARAAIAATDDAWLVATRLRQSEEPTSNVRLWAERRAAARSYLRIYRTLADPAMIDTRIDPDDRVPGGFEGHRRPDIQNYRQIGFAHLASPRAWLSTWSANASHATLGGGLAGVRVPTLLVHYAGDEFTRMAAIHEIKDVAASADFELHVVRRADHYGRLLKDDGSIGDRSPEGTAIAVRWLLERFAA
jgi:pimeloyl-ACP methyl ester carboxylesterase